MKIKKKKSWKNEKNIAKNEKNREKNEKKLLKWKEKRSPFLIFFTQKLIFISYALQFPAGWPEGVTHEYESHWQLQLL